MQSQDNSPAPDLDNTRVARAYSAVTQQIRRARRFRPTRRGCRGNWRLILFSLLMLPVFCCGSYLVIYLLFPPPPLDILVLGLDARAGEGYTTRTDTIMVAGVTPAQLRVSLLSIPRDLFIDVPNYGLQRINTVNVLGELEAEGRGPDLLGDAISSNFNIGIDRYARMDFSAFVEMIDAVGGVTIDVERTIVDNAYPTAAGGTISVRFEAGRQHMDGERALIYARTRHADDDYRRAERQQQVMAAFSRKLVNPLNWAAVGGVLARSVDTNLTLFDLLGIAPTVALNGGNFDRFVIDRDDITGAAGGQAVPNYQAIAPWIEERFD